MRFLKVIKSRDGEAIDFEEIEPKIREVCRELDIALLYLYGSYALGVAHKLSDLDVGFLPKRTFDLDATLRLLDKLQEIFEEEAVDLVDLSKAPLTLIHRVLKEGRCLYGKDLRTKIEFETRQETLYWDTEPLRRDYFKGLERRIKDGTFGYR
jgi:predicted nucleotidyltransferase